MRVQSQMTATLIYFCIPPVPTPTTKKAAEVKQKNNSQKHNQLETLPVNSVLVSSSLREDAAPVNFGCLLKLRFG